MTAIADYALLGDCQGAALVSRDGSVDWWCPARFDAPSVFTRLLDVQAGHWSIRPGGQFDTTRRYVEGSMVVQTDFNTAGGALRLTDALALGPGERGHQIGEASPHVLVRRVEALHGEVEVELELVARLEYGLVTPQLTATPLGIEVSGAAERLTLTGDRPLTVEQDRVVARFPLREGDSASSRCTIAGPSTRSAHRWTQGRPWTTRWRLGSRGPGCIRAIRVLTGSR